MLTFFPLVPQLPKKKQEWLQFGSEWWFFYYASLLSIPLATDNKRLMLVLYQTKTLKFFHSNSWAGVRHMIFPVTQHQSAKTGREASSDKRETE